ncbi:hypothetical protein K493DRAFT_314849 [Basidiobolus meristosporus CBS 931.73]|uniref:Uncharacterized protein n=1 Tax=Basidiobolus meristosporus CBS 931.73 TaxID=1314790 RepID=A0A1Y1YCV6_9FUNG|nr:hypothetical protein K493DRAFT_314849 [Basidiobolus meristosporus CBS 931.73]|eukprot:ORX95775.1 hypothetical protein K493DRAFT_314849 [Basidiobolus meristosporus CBS 931.73]
MNTNQQLSQDLNDETTPSEPPPPYTRFPEQHEIIADQGVRPNLATPSPYGNASPQANPQFQPPRTQAFQQNYQPGPSTSTTSYYSPGSNLYRPITPNGYLANPPHNTAIQPSIPPIPFPQYPQQWPSAPQQPIAGYNQIRPGSYSIVPPTGPFNPNFVCGYCDNRGWKRPGKLCTHCPYGQQLINSAANQPGTMIAPGVYVVKGRPCYKCQGQNRPNQFSIISSLANTLAPSVCSVCHGKGYL